MRTAISTVTIVSFLLLLAGPALSADQSGGMGSSGQYQGRQAPGPGWECPWCGQGYGPGPGYGMGPGMMHRGYGMGPGSGMGPGYGMGPGMMQDDRYGPYGQYGHGMMHRGYGRGYGPGGMHRGWGRGQGGQQPYQGQQQAGPLSKSEATMLLENYVAGNPNLKVGSVEEKEEVFEARIVTKDDSLVEKVIVDKQTGWMRRAY